MLPVPHVYYSSTCILPWIAIPVAAASCECHEMHQTTHIAIHHTHTSYIFEYPWIPAPVACYRYYRTGIRYIIVMYGILLYLGMAILQYDYYGLCIMQYVLTIPVRTCILEYCTCTRVLILDMAILINFTVPVAGSQCCTGTGIMLTMAICHMAIFQYLLQY